MTAAGAMGKATTEALARRWIQRVLASYGGPAMAQVASGSGPDIDPFRNPVAHTLRESLTTLARELTGAMDQAAVAAALDAVVRLRAVQDFSPAEAVGFVFELRSLVREECGAVDALLDTRIDARIDALALMAFNKYMNCREQIFELRAKELRLQAQYANR